MSSENRDDAAGGSDETARTVGQLVKYSRALNKSDTVGEVGTYALEATFHVMDGHPSPTVFEIRDGEARVLESMATGYATGDTAGPLAHRAVTGEQTVILADSAAVGYTADGVEILGPGDLAVDRSTPASLAAPSFLSHDSGDVGVVMLVEWDALERVDEHHVKPVEYLADYVATAVANIRSRERLERARNDLARRSKMIEMYDRLLRHDLGNDLQIITGYADALVSQLSAEGTDDADTDGEYVEFAETIQRTANSAAEMVERVGDVVKTVEADSDPEAHDLEPILSAAVTDVEAKFEDLSIDYDPPDDDVAVYAGDLLEAVFTNVLSNAAVHNDRAVTVAVGVDEPTPETVRVEFADDGKGVPPDRREGLFELGEKGPDSDGTGLGLGLVRALVESYGGDVAVGDSHLGGAAFRLTLQRV